MSVSGAGENPTTTTSSSQQNQITTSTTGASSPSSGGESSPVNSAGSQVNAGGSVTIDATPQIEAEAFGLINSVVTQALQNSGQTQQTQAQTVAAQTNSSDQVLAQVLAADQATAANSASGGQTNNNQTLTYIVLAVIAGIVAILIFRK